MKIKHAYTWKSRSNNNDGIQWKFYTEKMAIARKVSYTGTSLLNPRTSRRFKAWLEEGLDLFTPCVFKEVQECQFSLMQENSSLLFSRCCWAALNGRYSVIKRGRCSTRWVLFHLVIWFTAIVFLQTLRWLFTEFW